MMLVDPWPSCSETYIQVRPAPAPPRAPLSLERCQKRALNLVEVAGRIGVGWRSVQHLSDSLRFATGPLFLRLK
jgi:hypothetical protein